MSREPSSDAPPQEKAAHRPVTGLPASLLAPEGATFAAIALMQRCAGLNRDMKRDLAASKTINMSAAPNVPGASTNDRVIVSFYRFPRWRFTTFWRAANTRVDRTARASRRTFALAIDLQLLEAYMPEWPNVSFDADVLASNCSEWKEVQRRVRAQAQTEQMPPDQVHFQVFMAWPRLVSELSHWSGLSPDRLRAVAYATFALSSAAYTDWFVRRAAELCPQLAEEFATLNRSASSEATSHEGEPLAASTNSAAEAVEQAVVSVAPAPDWTELVGRLREVCDDLETEPTRSRIEDLVELAREFSSAAKSLPESVSLDVECRACVTAVLATLRRLAANPDFTWLQTELVDYVSGRWEAALFKCTPNQDALSELLADAQDAERRGNEAASEYREGARSLQAIAQEIETSEAALAQERRFAQRRALEQRRSDGRRRMLAAEDALNILQDKVLAAFSPGGAPIDYADVSEWPAENARRVDAAPSTTEAPDLPEETSAAREDVAISAPVAPAEASETLKATSPAKGEVPSERWDSAEPREATVEARRDDAQPFTDSAGEVCKPIWAALSGDHCSLAIQFARAVQEQSSETVVPHLELLEAVALAAHLKLSDGALKHSLADRYAKIDPAWFADEGPQAWHAAMNLLLVAATLRPMIITPDVGAESVAGYLRLGSEHREIWALCRRIGDISQRLQGVRIDSAAFRLLKDDAALEEQAAQLQKEAQRWLNEQAPAVTIKFAAATAVWRKWIRADGPVAQIVAPVVSNREKDVARVRALIAELSEPAKLHRRIHETDREARPRGEDIYAGALEHLERLAGEALQLARRWVAIVDTRGSRGDRIRALLKEVRGVFNSSKGAVLAELDRPFPGDTWQLVGAASSVVATHIKQLVSMLEGEIPNAEEPNERQVLFEDLLRVPGISLDDDWQPLPTGVPAIELLRNGLQPVTTAFEARLGQGDIQNAERLLRYASDSEHPSLQTKVRQALESWRSELRLRIPETRREVEIGSAYSYLSESERLQSEAELVQLEARIDTVRRFDREMQRLRGISARVTTAREERTADVREQLSALPDTPENRSGTAQIEEVLARGDLATAHEYVGRMRRGQPVWPAADRWKDPFPAFFPKQVTDIEQWLAQQPRDLVSHTIREGTGIASLPPTGVESSQRELMRDVYVAWLEIKRQRKAERQKLELVLRGAGFTLRQAEQRERAHGQEVWEISTSPIEDRNLCQVPLYGSFARGRYRVLCIWERPDEEDLVSAVGDAIQQRPTIVLHFGRMTEPRWRETSLLAKQRARAFLLIDECLLVRLAAEKGSRLAALFQLALPFSYSRPYDPTAGLVPQEMFFGRSSELEAVCGLNGRCFIYGGRQLGKTALLRRAEQSFHSPEHQRFAKWVDLRAEGIGVSRTPGDVWVCLTEILRQLGVLDEGTQPPNTSRRGSQEALLNAIKAFMSADEDRRVLLLLDEADKFFEQDSHSDFLETRRLKQLMESTGRRFKVVFAGLHNVLRMTDQANHPLAHLGEPIKIGPFVSEEELREAERLVRAPMAAAGFEFESEALVVRILAQTNYFPSLIQLYCHHLLTHMLERLKGPTRLIGPRYKITDRDVEAVYSSGALRSEIRTRFRLTLQLDPRYELIAYALAYDLLRERYPRGDGVEWQQVWQSTTQYWWPQGFRGTSQLQFRNLLDEMVELGVLSRNSSRYTLRNPNVLLLLGTLDEIESVLMQDRELPVEFNPTSFHPPIRGASHSPFRNPLTYAQLEQLTRRANLVVGVSGTTASGITDIAAGLKDYLGTSGRLAVLNDCTDKSSFHRSLRETLEGSRSFDGTTLIYVSPEVPWTQAWVVQGASELKKLRSASRFATLVFGADPAVLSLLDTSSEEVTWMILLPWEESFVRNWLQEQHLPHDAAIRKRLKEVTGYWPSELTKLLKDCSSAGEFASRLDGRKTALADSAGASEVLGRLGFDIRNSGPILLPLAILEQPMPVAQIQSESGRDLRDIETCLRRSALLGHVTRIRGEYWQLDPFVGKLLTLAAID